MLTKYVLLENVLKPDYDENVSKVIDFIDKSYSNRLTILQLSRKIGISKTALYKLFRQHFSCTVNDYVNSVRIEKSLKLLENRALSIEEISRLAGFSSAAYYSKLFKAKKGISPIKYRCSIE